MPIPVLAETSSGKFTLSCVIEDHTLLKLDQGKGSVYEGYTESEKQGDGVEITFDYFIDDSTYYFTIANSLVYGSESIVGHPYKGERTNTRVFNYISDKDAIGDNQRDLFLSDETIYMSAHPYVLRMNRYYKNDWNLFYYVVFTPTSTSFDGYMLAANCMNMPDGYNKMLGHLEKFHLVND